jgi:primary-amine oxidase
MAPRPAFLHSLQCWLAIGVLLWPFVQPRFYAAERHPLDPLTKEELASTVRLLRAHNKVTEQSRFPIIVLHEPPKDEVLRYAPGSPLRRQAFAVVYERARNQTFEAIVDLAAKKVASWKEIPGVQPPLMEEDLHMVDALVRADPGWQEAIRKRGITDLDHVAVDPWPIGAQPPPDQRGARLLNAVSYYRGNARNYYARPIEGVVAQVNLTTGKVVRILDTGVVPVPKGEADFDPGSVGPLRKAPKPLRVMQAQGAGFELHGNEVRWQNWRFRFSLHPREGLVLHTVGYEDRGKLRSILYRAGIAELVVPYGDASAAWSFRNVFDMGEGGLGWLAGSLEPLTDCPENATFVNAFVATDKGVPREIPRAIGIYERDGGLLWKHFDYQTNESRRGRELVIGFIATLGNYEYGLNWIFHQDGCLEAEVVLTGIMSTKAVAGDAPEHGQESHGHLVASKVEAVHHQHFFNFRLDMDIDGAACNSVAELDTQARPAKTDNGMTLVMTETLLGREQDARRQLNQAASRKWKVFNPSVKNALGMPVGYLLVPGENAMSYVDPDSSVGKRAGFLSHQLWVTPYDPGERYPAGDYVFDSRGGEGLPQWTQANRPLENQDLVLWYTLGITHIPRPEEWPVMPVHRAGFKLMPSGFFARNPALDLPRQRRDGTKPNSGR